MTQQPRSNFGPRAWGAACYQAVLLALCSACAAPRQHVQPMGPSPISDESVTPFHSDTANSWSQFRLGGGLNVVVVNPHLPREPSWRFNAGREGISSSPVVYRDLVLVASNDGSLYAIDAATGALRWRYFGTDELMTQPVYANGIVVVASGNADCYVCFYPRYVVQGTGLNEIAGVSLQTGAEIWRQRLAGTGMPTPALVAGRIIHADGSGAVLALDQRTGKSLWATVNPSSMAMSSIVDAHDGRVYASGVFGATVYALRASDGALEWRHYLSQYYQGTGDAPMATSGLDLISEYLQRVSPGPPWGWVVWAAAPVRHHIFALDRRNGGLIWDTVIASGTAPQWNTAAISLVYRGRLYVGTPVAPLVSCLDVRTGRLIWQLHTRGVVKGGIAARDGLLYFGDLAGYLWAVDALSGKMVGRLRLNLSFRVGSPIIVNDSLVDGSEEGTVVAIPLRKITSSHDVLEPARDLDKRG